MTSKPGVMKFNARRKGTFLKVLGKTGLINKSAAAAGVHPSTVYEHIQHDPEFKAEVERVRTDFNERLEAEAYRRAVDGYDEPVYQKGERVGFRRVFSDGLLTLMLKKNIPEYRDKITADVNHSGSAVLVVPLTPEDSREWERQQLGGDSADQKDSGR